MSGPKIQRNLLKKRTAQGLPLGITFCKSDIEPWKLPYDNQPQETLLEAFRDYGSRKTALNLSLVSPYHNTLLFRTFSLTTPPNSIGHL